MSQLPVSQAHALSQYVFKVHSRCDLACDHCYVYEHADQSWRRRPRIMSPAIVEMAANRIADHAAAHHLDQIHVVLHGGEPLLMGADALRTTLATLRATIEPVASLDLRMQSNGVRLSAPICDLLVEFDVRLGISLDGDRQANDRHRRFANGNSSHGDVMRALRLLRMPAYQRVYAGILCTIDIANDPIEVYRALVAQAPPRLDFLLPHATWDRPPPRPAGDPAPYARWLLRIHAQWLADGRPVPIRLFGSLMAAADGAPSGLESVGLDPADFVVVETDGTWEQADSMKTTFDGGPATGMDVFAHSVDTVAAYPDIARRQGGLADLCATCRACPLVRQCGGGLFAHRYRGTNGFDNPSVYCGDLQELVSGINRRPSRPAAVAVTPSQVGGTLPDDIFDQIGSGYGDEAAVGYLAEAELGIARALIVAIGDRAAADPIVSAGWALLADVDQVAPEAVRSVLAHPYVRVWAADLLGRTVAAAVDEWPYLCCVAAAAAARAGITADIDVPLRAGRLHLPTVGTVTVASSNDTARMSLAAGGFTVRAGDAVVTVTHREGACDTDGWRPARRVGSGGWDLLVEDSDPYRDRYPWQAEGRLSTTAMHGWRQLIADAWQVVRQQAPAQAGGLAIGLRVLVPLRADAGGRLRSATLRHAFGAFGMAMAPPDALAVMLVHEFQHTKLGAVLDLCDLLDPACTRRFRVGWRPDLRPPEAILQGTYAHLAVADIWRVRAAGPAGEPAAVELFHRYRDWTSTAIETLSGSGALTPAGSRFVSRMAGTLAAW